jgi:hypothetical protein
LLTIETRSYALLATATQITAEISSSMTPRACRKPATGPPLGASALRRVLAQPLRPLITRPTARQETT